MKISLLFFLFLSGVLGANGQDRIEFSHQSGFYYSSFALKVNSIEGNTLRYTVDGSEPTNSSDVLNDSIPITPLNHIPDVISHVQTGLRKIHPMNDPYKANVIRVASFKENKVVSPIYSRTYWVDIEKKSRYSNWPILSVFVEPAAFFDDSIGIYVKGINENYKQRGGEWRKNIAFEYFDSTGKSILIKEAEVKIHGGKSREQAQKSLKIYCDEAITSHFFESDKLKGQSSFMLRNAMSCWQKTIIKDDLTASICKGLSFPYSESQPIIVFINGEYWGIHTIRPVFNESYFNQDLNKEAVYVVDFKDYVYKAIPQELSVLYKELELISKLNFSKTANYEYALNLFDEANLIDYYCAELFFDNKDWPHNNFKIVWNPTTKKIRLLFYDLDASWTNAEVKSITGVLTNPNKSYPKSPGFIFPKFMENDEFKKKFGDRMIQLINNEFSSERLLAQLEIVEKQYRPLVNEHTRRWTIPGSYSQWEGKIGMLKSFARARPKNVRDEIIELCNLEQNYRN